jgi:hypothetical protein
MVGDPVELVRRVGLRQPVTRQQRASLPPKTRTRRGPRARATSY